MNKEIKIPVEDILSVKSNPHFGKSIMEADILISAWEAKQRGETEIIIKISTDTVPCKGCDSCNQSLV